MTKKELIDYILNALETNPGKLLVNKISQIPFTESKEKSLSTLSKKDLEEIVSILNFENAWPELVGPIELPRIR